MTNRERFHAAMNFEPTDRPCHIEQGFWPETYERWKKEGLPEYVNYPEFSYLSNGIDLFKYFDIAKFGYILPGQYYIPDFGYKVLEENEDYRVVRNERGVTLKEKKKNVSIPQFLEYPVKSRRDYEIIKERLIPDIDKRYPSNWESLVKSMREQEDTLIVLHLDGFFGYPRELMGVERLLTMFYDDPDLMKDVINDRLDFYITLHEKAIKDIKHDFIFIWEDMCFKNGPLISPALFREFLLPAYKKLTSFLRSIGIKNIVVDSDGDVLKLIPLWIEGGVTGILPFEVKAGMDVVKIGKDFPNLQILGGIEKHQLEKTKSDIEKEIDRVLPYMLKRGGYVVTLDHWVHSEISLDNFRYYVERVKNYKL